MIQVFFSEIKAEQIQIMGRCARQGQDGSYNIIMNEICLDKFISSQNLSAEVKSLKNKNILYEELCRRRDENYDNVVKHMLLNLKNKEIPHKSSMELRNFLYEKSEKDIIASLIKFNIGQEERERIKSRILCLIDGTGSMRPSMLALKSNLQRVFERSSKILQDNKIPSGCFQVQIAVYRDYDNLEQLLLEISPWRNEPTELIKFITEIEPIIGKSRNEAVEIGLQHANREHKRQKINQVILIGDAPAKSQKEIKYDRNLYGGEHYWAKTRYFNQKTFWSNECIHLREAGIPVNSFFLRDDQALKENFHAISKSTGGKAQWLNLTDDDLTNMFCQNILNSIGSGLVGQYRKNFGGGSYI